MAIVQETPSGVVILPTAGPPGVSIVGPPGPEGEAGATGQRGPVGPQGPAGAGSLRTRTASSSIPRWCVVTPSGDGLCAPIVLGDDPTVVPNVLGVCVEGGDTNSVVAIVSQGDAVGSSQGSWLAGDTLYVGSGGVLTNSRPVSGWNVRVGIAGSPNQIVIYITDPEWIVPPALSSAIGSVIVQALTQFVASLPTTMPDDPGVLWRNQTFTALSPYSDGSPYNAPPGGNQSGTIDPITALLGTVVPRAMRSLPTAPPSAPGSLWRNGVRIALTPGADGNAYPTTPLPSTGSDLLIAVRAALGPWLVGAMPAFPTMPPLSAGTLWRTADHALALSI